MWFTLNQDFLLIRSVPKHREKFAMTDLNAHDIQQWSKFLLLEWYNKVWLDFIEYWRSIFLKTLGEICTHNYWSIFNTIGLPTFLVVAVWPPFLPTYFGEFLNFFKTCSTQSTSDEIGNVAYEVKSHFVLVNTGSNH